MRTLSAGADAARPTPTVHIQNPQQATDLSSTHCLRRLDARASGVRAVEQFARIPPELLPCRMLVRAASR